VRTSPTQLQRLGEVPEEVLASHRRELIDARAYEKACGALATCMGAESSLIARGTTLGALCRGLGALCMGFGAECRGMEALCKGVMALCRGFGAKAEGLRVMSKACTCPLEALPHSQLPKVDLRGLVAGTPCHPSQNMQLDKYPIPGSNGYSQEGVLFEWGSSFV
jgi:hypothetical protein